MHKSRHDRAIKGTGGMGKVAVMGLLERHGEVRVKVVADRRKGTLQSEVRTHLESGSELFTDALKSYSGLRSDYVHQVIDHAEKYVDGQIHTNGMENFWSLLKRCVKGTYVSVEPFHLFRYLDEQAFRFNSRKTTDAMRFVLALAINRRKASHLRGSDRKRPGTIPRRRELEKRRQNRVKRKAG